MSFETKLDKTESSCTKTTKTPVGNFGAMDWDNEAVKAEVQSYPDGTQVNWSDLARRHVIKNTTGELAKNGGQIAQEWLKYVGVDTNRFKRLQSAPGKRVRRKKLRGAGGEITVATPQTNTEIKNDLQKKILSGEYLIGELITPKKVHVVVYVLLQWCILHCIITVYNIIYLYTVLTY